MPLYLLLQDELRSYCKKYSETLESWLRRLVDEEMTKKHWNNYFNALDKWWQKVINNRITKSAENRAEENKWRYQKLIDATVFDDLIDIICKHYELFKTPLEHAFPNWENVMRYFLTKIKEIRNKLSHVNPISVREAEQLICYSNDIIESLKINYKEKNMESEYNVPRFIKFIDSFWNEANTNDLSVMSWINHNIVSFDNKPGNFLRPGDMLSIEVEVDSSFDSSEYIIKWDWRQVKAEWNKINIDITEDLVWEIFIIECSLKSNKKWHRHTHYDDRISFMYKVLPPI